MVACALFGIVAMDLKRASLMQTYSWLLAYLLILDVVWHHFWVGAQRRHVKRRHVKWHVKWRHVKRSCPVLVSRRKLMNVRSC